MRYLKVVGNRPTECVKSVGHYAKALHFEISEWRKIIIFQNATLLKLHIVQGCVTTLLSMTVCSDCLVRKYKKPIVL